MRNVSTKGHASVHQATVLYENSQQRPLLFVFIGALSLLQMGFWTYLAAFAYSHLEEERLRGRGESADQVSLPSGRVLSSPKWRAAASMVALTAGVFFAYTANMLAFRTVLRLSFMKHSNMVALATYTPWGTTRVVMTPLTSVQCCKGSRIDTLPQVALKLKGYPLYFLLDKKAGTFLEPTNLFDSIIATRHWTN